MSLSSIELWQRIKAADLASPMQCRAWAAETSQSLSAADSTNGLKVLQKLIELERLTKYQAKILAGQSDQPLQRDGFHILGRVKHSIFGNWLEIRPVDSGQAENERDSSDGSTWGRWLTVEEIRGLQPCAPSLKYGIQLACTDDTRLHKVFMPQKLNDHLLVQVAPVTGSLLAEKFNDERPSVETAQEIIAQISHALEPLHRAGIAHGRVLPDRVSWDEKTAVLITDPICRQTIPLDSSGPSGVLESKLGDLKPQQFLAPEFIAPGQVPALASDVYSLGCLWWWLLTGKAIADGESTHKILANATEAKLELPSCVELLEPWQKILRHMLGKNPASRFSDASELSKAIEAASKTIEKGVIVPQPAPQGNTRQDSVGQDSVGQTAGVAGAAGASDVQDVAPEAVERTLKAKEKAAAGSVNAAQKKPSTKKSAQPTPDSTPRSKEKPKKQAKRAGKANSPPTPSNPKLDTKKQSEEASQKPGVAERSTQPAMRAESSPSAADPSKLSENAASATLKKPAAKASAASTPPSSLPGSPRGVAVRGEDEQRKAVPRRVIKKRKRAKNKLLLPVAAGCGFLALLLIVLKWSGALEPRPQKKPVKLAVDFDAGSTAIGENAQPKDERLEIYQVVPGTGNELWLPPARPQPFKLDLLPPGGQLFVSIRPGELFSSADKKSLVSAFDEQLSPWLKSIADIAGQPLASLSNVVLAFYEPADEGGPPVMAYRFELQTTQPLGKLRSGWGPQAEEVVDGVTFLADADHAVFISNAATSESSLSDVLQVKEFSVVDRSLMQDLATLGGAAGPLTTPVARLHAASDQGADISILVSPPYLFTAGRSIIENMPARLASTLRDFLGADARSALLQMRFEPEWYSEFQAMGPSDIEAGPLLTKFKQFVSELPVETEQHFVEETPHAYWRALAFRLPQMLRYLNEHSRFGVENGVAMSNFYLPKDAAENLLLAGWIGLRDFATASSGSDAVNIPVAALSVEEYLARPINLRFELEPIESVLQLIADEANDRLPGGTAPMRFTLDGDAFEKDGITRNQQLSEFNLAGRPVRDALTAVAKAGNPVPADDLRQANQKLIWVIVDDPDQPGRKMISVTTRAAAESTGISIPPEF